MRSADAVLADVAKATAVASGDGGRGASLPGPNVWFDGAESFAHPELPHLISGALERGVERLRLTTGGAALAFGGNAEVCLDAGVHQLEVVVLSVTQTPDAGASVAPFEWVLEGVGEYVGTARLRGTPVAVAGRVLVCEHTYETTPATVAALAATGAVAIGVDVRTLGTSLPSEAEWLRAVRDSGVVNRAWVYFQAGTTTRAAAVDRMQSAFGSPADIVEVLG